VSRKAFKASLKSEIEQKIPNVLNKIDLENIHIKEKEVAPSRFRRPVLRLVTSFSLAIIVLIAVATIAINSFNRPLYSKEEEAAVISAVSAYQLSTSSQALSVPYVTVSNDNDNGNPMDLVYEVFDQIYQEIDPYFESVETFLLASDIKPPVRLNKDTLELNINSKHLNGSKVEFSTKYTTEKNDDGTSTINGELYLGDKLVSKFKSVIGEDGKITTTVDNVTIVNYTENEVQIFEISRKTNTGTVRSTIRHYFQDKNEIIELEPECKASYDLFDPNFNFFKTKRKFQFITKKEDGNDIVEISIKTDYQGFGFFDIGSEFRIIVSVAENGETDDFIEYNYDFRGKVNILGAVEIFDSKYQTKSRHRKRK
jgi:hypothetical protein